MSLIEAETSDIAVEQPSENQPKMFIDDFEKLVAAAGEGDIIKVKSLLDAGVSPGARSLGKRRSPREEEGVSNAIDELERCSSCTLQWLSNIRGRTALQAAAEGGHEQVVRLLLETGADVNAQPSSLRGRTALQAAAEGGYESLVKLLLKEGAEVNAMQSIIGGKTALRAAAEEGHESVVKLLLEAKAGTSAAPETGNIGIIEEKTALQAAAEVGHESVVKLLLDFKVDVNARPLGYCARTALQASAAGGHESVVKLLLDAKADINAPPSPNGTTALQAAAGKGHESIVKLLLNARADINAPPAVRGRTTLQAAAEGGHKSVVKLLLGARADINAPPPNYRPTALQAAAMGGHELVVKMLLDAGAEVNVLQDGGAGSLRYAAMGGRESVVKLLLDLKVDINTPKQPPKETALQAAAKLGHELVVKLLLDAGADVNAPPSNYGQTALQGTASGGYELVAKLLLDAGADVNAQPSKYGKTALTAAVSGGFYPVVKLLLDAGATVDRELLHVACFNGSEEMSRILYERGAAILGQDQLGRTPLHVASLNGHLHLVQWLLSLVPEININSQDYEGQTPLHLAIKYKHLEIVDYLLQRKANLEVVDSRGRKPLGIALETGFLKGIELLLKNGASMYGIQVDSWCTIPSASGILAIKEEHTHCKIVNVTAKPPGSGWKQQPLPSRCLYSVLAAKYKEISLFQKSRTLPSPISPGGARIAWIWGLSDKLRNTSISNTSIPNPSTITAQASQKEMTIRCEISFPFFIANDRPEGEAQTRGVRSEDSKIIATKSFKTKLQESQISWDMVAGTDLGPGSKSSNGTSPRVTLHTVDYRNSLSNSWIPDHSMEFVTLFISDLHNKWRELFKAAQEHQANNYEKLLARKGRTPDLIEHLLKDAQEWAKFRSQLKFHIGNAEELRGLYEENCLLYIEVKYEGPEPRHTGKTALSLLSEAIKTMESECGTEISELEKKTKEMIDLEFSLVSIYEVQRSTSMAASMKRLSWITFIFLPLMFVATLFGMNINLLQGGTVAWQLYPAIGGPILVVVLVVWLLFKHSQIDDWCEKLFATLVKKMSGWLSEKLKARRQGEKEKLEGDLEAGGATNKAVISLPKLKQNKWVGKLKVKGS